jgi:heme O synthase-like polyprenyltransferase
VLVNWFAAALLAFTIFFYVFVYTMWLKRSTPQNIVIGGAAGAFPPMIGWAAVTGDITLAPVLMFLIIFFWTPPHFWALSLLRADDYARAGIPMLPVVAGPDETRRQILIYSLVLAPVGLSPTLFGFAGLTYGAFALVCGAAMVALALARLPRAHRACGGNGRQAAVRLLAALRLRAVRRAARRQPADAAWIRAMSNDDGIVLTEEQKRRRRARSIAIALSLGVLVLLFYAVTLVKGPAVLVRPVVTR